MNQVAIVYPVFVQALLTFCVYGLLAVSRSRALRVSGRTRGGADLAMGRFTWPEDAEKRAANQRNQFELPVLFYAVAGFALVVGAADALMLGLAWAFVLTRIAHAAIHIGPNKVRWRAPMFALGLLILLAMWVKLVLHVMTRGIAV